MLTCKYDTDNRATLTCLSQIFRYLKELWRHEHPDEKELEFSASQIPRVKVEAPMQKNYCDCGVFVLEYVERLLKAGFKGETTDRPMGLPRYPEHGKLLRFDMKEMPGFDFTARTISKKRQDLKKYV